MSSVDCRVSIAQWMELCICATNEQSYVFFWKKQIKWHVYNEKIKVKKIHIEKDTKIWICASNLLYIYIYTKANSGFSDGVG